MAFEAAGRTDVGLRREHNEDALLVLPEFGLAVVCDGLGGHQAGEVASAMAIETVRMFFERTRDPQVTWPFPYDDSRDEPTNLLGVAVQWANRRDRKSTRLNSSHEWISYAVFCLKKKKKTKKTKKSIG